MTEKHADKKHSPETVHQHTPVIDLEGTQTTLQEFLDYTYLPSIIIEEEQNGLSDHASAQQLNVHVNDVEGILHMTDCTMTNLSPLLAIEEEQNGPFEHAPLIPSIAKSTNNPHDDSLISMTQTSEATSVDTNAPTTESDVKGIHYIVTDSTLTYLSNYSERTEFTCTCTSSATECSCN